MLTGSQEMRDGGGRQGRHRMRGWKEVASKRGYISCVFQVPVREEPQSWPMRRRRMGMFRDVGREAVWVILSTDAGFG